MNIIKSNRKTKKNLKKNIKKYSKKNGGTDEVLPSYVFRDNKLPKELIGIIRNYETVPVENDNINDLINIYYMPNNQRNIDPNDDYYDMYELKEKIRLINRQFQPKLKLKLNGRRSELIDRINNFYKKYDLDRKNKIIKKYGKIENWDLSKITIMNPDVRMAYELNTEFQRKKSKIPMIKDIEIDKKKERENMRMNRYNMMNEDLRNLNL